MNKGYLTRTTDKFYAITEKNIIERKIEESETEK